MLMSTRDNAHATRKLAPMSLCLAGFTLALATLTGPPAQSAAPPAAGRPPPTQPAADPELSRELDALLPALAARDYRARERAQDRLVEIGPAARPPLERFLRETASAEGRTGATLALDRIKANSRFGPTFAAFTLPPNATIDQACAALVLAGGIPVSPEPGGPAWPRAGLDVRHQPYWGAVRRVCEAFGAAPRPHEYPTRLELAPDPAWAKKPWQQAPGCLVVYDGADVLGQRDEDRDRDPNRHVQLRFQVYFDPAIRGLTHLHYLEIQEAKDEHGQSLAPPPGVVRGAVGSGSGSFSFDSQITIRNDQKHPTRLASFRGRAGVLVQTKATTIEVADLPDVKDVTRAAAGVKLTVHSAKPFEGGWAVPVTLRRDGASDRVWELARAMYYPLSVRMVDASGSEDVWVPQSPGREPEERTIPGQEAKAVQLTLKFLHTHGPEAAAKAAKPAKLVWELPAETAELEIPIEFADLPLP